MLIQRVEQLETDIQQLKIFISMLPKWMPLHSFKSEFNVKSPQSILRRLENNFNFEPDVDYKKIGEVWYVNIKALPKLKMLYS